ncbi:hypothetical protein GCM10008955_37980 [Deinococcus malanensis]|uniref:DUF2382 domain-containing protein n=2 Tax=Deinococcus malanensis TaxID=1706855 RepID=A0ABQ2F4M9_9DEIO|nr:hypothetical protein GCM10008955_37980 [Deinococcus malanensis]
MHNPVGQPAHISGGQTIGRVADALVDDTQGRIRYLVVDQDGGDINGSALIPIGLARIENDGVYFDDLTTSQYSSLHRYSDHEEYTFEHQSSDERVLRGATGTAAMTSTTTTETTQHGYNYRDEDTSDRLFKTPERLQLLEERLVVDKERYLAGSVQIGKHVETRQENVAVQVEHEEVVIERHAVGDGRPVEGNVHLGDNTTVRVDVEAERANIGKQAFVTEEVSVGKRTITETETHTAEVGREVLDVDKSGDVNLNATPDDRRDR